MRNTLSIFHVLILTLALASIAFAEVSPKANSLKGIITEVHASRGIVFFTPVDSEDQMTFKTDGSVDVNRIRMDQKVIITLENKEGTDIVTKITNMFIDFDIKSFAFILLVGFIGGLISGFIGSGGAFVLTPAMMSLGVPAAVAVASNMCHKFPKAMVGAYKRFKYGQVDLKLGLIMAASATIGVQVGIKMQEYIFNKWGDAGSNLYVSLAFVLILVTVGGYVFYDACTTKRGSGEEKAPRLALMLQKITIPPMIHFKTANLKISLWITMPVGFATGMLAATIGVGGFIGVPGMIYIFGASSLVASATELVIAFVMGFGGSIKWALAGLIDIRLTLFILVGSLVGVQLGALGTTYVKENTIKIVMGSIMLIVAISRGMAVPTYLNSLGIVSMDCEILGMLDKMSFFSMVAALLTGAAIILSSMIRGMKKARHRSH